MRPARKRRPFGVKPVFFIAIYFFCGFLLRVSAAKNGQALKNNKYCTAQKNCSCGRLGHRGLPPILTALASI
jgi:hypothetical protein